MRLLLEHGTVDAQPDLRGCTAAELARLNGHAAVAKVLNESAALKVRCFTLLYHAQIHPPCGLRWTKSVMGSSLQPWL